MASSDDEGEAVPHTVSNYHFVDDKDEPIAFSELPVQWNEGEGLDGKSKQIFLHGTADNVLQKIYKQVTAWKFDLSDAKPAIAVLSKENNWINLQKPRKSFEDTIRTILITVHCLHFVKKNPETSGRSLWNHLSKVFSLYEVRPSENDLIDHITLISEAVKRDETLAKSKFLVTFLEEKPRKKKAFDEDIGTTAKAGFIVDDDMIDENEDDGSDEEEDLFDSVCSICDNGGELLCCEGRCMRSFHATVEAGSESMCDSLGLSDEQVEAIQNFFCKNCQYKKHQCFSCGELGSSDKLSGAEVFSCVSATCGRFYHPHCVAKLLHRGSAAEAEELEKKIAAGESFTCPIHKCIVCKQGENKMDPDLQFAVCRRCPKSYHRKCLPTKISFEDVEDEGIVQRAWDGLLPNRILIYCLKHEIDDEVCTPVRNHIKFPDDGQKKKKQASQPLLSKEKVLQKGRSLASEDSPRKSTLGKVQRGVGLSSFIKEGSSLKKRERILTGLNTSKKQKVVDTSRKPLNNTAVTKVRKSTTDANRVSLGERLYALVSKGSRNEDTFDGEHKQTPTDKPVATEMSSSLALDDDRKRRILALMKDATSSITLEAITEKHKVPTTHAYSSKYVVDKSFTLGKVEGSVEALRVALQKLEGGCSIEDAKMVCGPELLPRMVKWKNKLKVYLAPFLYGMRYTSFGRHFTKVDKLKEIVDVLHRYVQNGDTIVDFCCGANDFSCLMKKKLDETGKKKCSYKNYDVLQAKNDFNFEQRDWMSVHPRELPTGSQLIMGLNPPFGVNATLANKFIDKALEFKPKLLILIVPRETERLDKKKTDTLYDLVWEDDELLAGKSFYLPGSVDVNDNQLEDWNVSTPPLYLWSRPDWTTKHKAIAQQHGHLLRVQKRSHLEENHDKPMVSDHPMEVHDPNVQTSVSMDQPPVQNAVPEEFQEKRANVSESDKEDLPRGNGDSDREVHGNRSHDKNLLNGDSKKKRKRGKGKNGKGSSGTPQKDKERRRSSPARKIYDRIPHHSPPNVTGGISLNDRSSRPPEVASHMEVSKEADQHFDQNVAGSRSHFRIGYEGSPADDIARRYRLNSEEEPYSGVAHRRSRGTSPVPDYGVRNSEGQFAGYQRESMESRGYRPYVSEIEDKYARESAIRSQPGLYGQQNPDTFGHRSGFLAGQDPGFASSYSYLGSAPDPYGMNTSTMQQYAPRLDATNTSTMQQYAPRLDVTNTSTMHTSTMQQYAPRLDAMNTSAMQRYAPRLDELNHTRMNTFGGEPPRNVITDPLASQRGYRVDTLGFASGPHRPFSQNNTSGWLNE